jgi:phospholipase C
VSPFLPEDHAVDHTQYDTTSILATIERRFGLRPLNTRDAAVADLLSGHRPRGEERAQTAEASRRPHRHQT